MKRPKTITLNFYDPWTLKTVLWSKIPYDREQAAKSYYSRLVKRLLKALPSIQSDILQHRKPKIKIRYLF